MRIGVFTGKFKPPHAGHHRTILEIADQNDETHVFVSPRTEGGISGKAAVEVLQLYFADRPDINIHLAPVSPVGSAYDFVEELGQSPEAGSVELTVYALPEDLKRFSTLEKFKGGIGKISREETARPDFEHGTKVSGTLMRQFLKAGDRKNFEKGLPTRADKDRVWQIVSQEVEEQGTWRIPADSFRQQIDPNIMPTEINVPVGGLPAHWTTSQPYSRFDLKTNPLADRYGRNPKSRAVKTFSEFCQEHDSDK